MQVFYNSANKTLSIQNKEEQEILYSIYASTGNLIMSKRTSEKSLNLDVSSLSKGFYIVKAIGENKYLFQTKNIVIN